MKSVRTWILIADGARARILESTGKGKGVQPVAGSDLNADHRPSRELLADRPGHVYESVGSARHAVEPRTDPHRALERLFAYQLADILAGRLAAGEFDRLIVVAPPGMLGDLRKALSAPVRETVAAEVGKDLTKVPNHEILQHLAGVTAL